MTRKQSKRLRSGERKQDEHQQLDDDDVADTSSTTSSMSESLGTSASSLELPGQNPLFSDDFIRKIPKANLHCHLDGSVRVQTVIDLAKQQGVQLPAYSEVELNKILFKDDYNSLEEYLECFGYTTAIMRTPEALERIAYEFALDEYGCGVRYFEVRYAPQLFAVPGKLSLQQVMELVDVGLRRATKEHNNREEVVNGSEPKYGYSIIVCAMRFFNRNFSPYYESFWDIHSHEPPARIYGLASMALVTAAYELKHSKNIPIVALDIAGAEKGFPANQHIEAFAFAQKKFLHKTVHAGEGFGPESIFQAITDLHAERIGHGLSLFDSSEVTVKETQAEKEVYVRELADFVAHSRVCVEICLTSNLQTVPNLRGDTNGVATNGNTGNGKGNDKNNTALTKQQQQHLSHSRLKQRHPFRKMLNHKISLSLCTDNNTVSKTNMIKEVRLAVDTFDMTAKELKDVIVTGFKRSFMNCPYEVKRRYNRSVIEYYEKLEKEFGVV
eukprot:c9495_g1_i1.p1 GENE.c9495_g1_i1~~c9495_g1_i1.p1  ORF type:complete len:498 (+),score=129.23 c9495_g1_i1:176-1669(+)